MGQRTWIKINCVKWLEGTLRQESAEFRGIWADILALAGNSNYGDSGTIKLPNEIGIPDETIGRILNISPDLWGRFKKKFIATHRLNIKKNNIITIANWGKYQSDYQRQKPYRQGKEDNNSNSTCNQKLQPIVTSKVTTNSYTGDRDRDRDRESKEEPAATSSHYKDVLGDLDTKEIDRLTKTLSTHFKVNIHQWVQKAVNKGYRVEAIILSLKGLWEHKDEVKQPYPYLNHILSVEHQNMNEREAMVEHKKIKDEELRFKGNESVEDMAKGVTKSIT